MKTTWVGIEYVSSLVQDDDAGNIALELTRPLDMIEELIVEARRKIRLS